MYNHKVVRKWYKKNKTVLCAQNDTQKQQYRKKDNFQEEKLSTVKSKCMDLRMKLF